VKFSLLRNLIPGALFSGLPPSRKLRRTGKPHPSALLLFFLSLSLSLGSSEASASEDPKLREIMEKHVEAMGGWRNWSEVESIRLSGTIERGGQTVDFVIIKKRPNQIRATITVPVPGKEDEALQVIRAHDGDSAWTATRLAGAPNLKKEPLDSADAASLSEDAGPLPPLIKRWRAGTPLEYLGVETLEGKPVHHLRTIPEASDGERQSFYLSSEDFFLRKTETLGPDGELLSATRYSVYRPKAGIMVPTDVVIDSPTTGRSRMRTESTEIGVGIYEEYFGGASAEARIISNAP